MRHRASCTAVLLTLTACSAGDDAGTSGVQVRDTVVEHRGDTVSVRIVENPAAPVDVALWRVAPEPMLDLGGEGAPEDASLFRVAGAVRLGDGRVVVADGGSTSLKVFAADGALLQSVGGPGSGPGEFRSLQFFGRLAQDSLVVFDLGLGRLSVFTADGVLAREARIGAAAGSPRSSVRGVFADGSLLSAGFIDLGGRVPDGLERHVAALYHLDAGGMLLDSIGATPGSEGWYTAFDGGFGFRVPPFARSSDMIAAGDRLYIADTGVAEVRVEAPDGTPRMRVRWSASPAAVDADRIAAAREHAQEEARDEGDRRAVAEMFETMPMPATVPALSRVRVDAAGRIWVRDWTAPWAEPANVRWRIFAADGALVATADLPAAFVPTDIGEAYVLGTWRDALDVEHVRLYGLER